VSTPLPPAAQTLKVVINGTTSAGRNWANVLHFKYTGSAPTVAICESLAEVIYGIWVSGLIPMQGEDIAITGVYITDLTSATSAEGGYELETAGSRSGDPIPAGASALASYSILFRYRGGHPRQYILAGVVTDLLNTSAWTTEFVGDMVTAWGGFLSSVSGSASGGTTIAGQVAVSYYSANVRRVAAEIIPLTFTGISGIVASQRRRTRRRA